MTQSPRRKKLMLFILFCLSNACSKFTRDVDCMGELPNTTSLRLHVLIASETSRAQR